MMNITLLAAQAALADTLAGGNPVLTPVSEEARMNLWDMAMKGGYHACAGIVVCRLFLYFL